MATKKFKKLPKAAQKAAFAHMPPRPKKPKYKPTIDPKKSKAYYANVDKGIDQKKGWTQFYTDEGVAGVRAFCKKKKWRIESKIHSGEIPKKYRYNGV